MILGLLVDNTNVRDLLRLKKIKNQQYDLLLSKMGQLQESIDKHKEDYKIACQEKAELENDKRNYAREYYQSLVNQVVTGQSFVGYEQKMAKFAVQIENKYNLINELDDAIRDLNNQRHELQNQINKLMVLKEKYDYLLGQY